MQQIQNRGRIFDAKLYFTTSLTNGVALAIPYNYDGAQKISEV